MKKTMLPLMAAAAFAVIATGCTTITTSDGASLRPAPATQTSGYDVDYSVKTVRAKGDAQINVLFGLFAWGANGFAENSELSTFSFLPSPANYAKSAAVYNACQTAKVDTLLATRYKVTTKDYFIFKQVKCEVSGFPAEVGALIKQRPFVLRGKEADTLVWLNPAVAPIVLK